MAGSGVTLPAMEFLHTPELRPAFVFFSSFAVGLLVGLERERRPLAKAGVRTFALITGFGTLCAMLAEQLALPWLVAMGLIAVAAALIVAHAGVPDTAEESGTTTVIAAAFCYLLGAGMWLGHLELCVALGIVVAVLLYFKTDLEAFSQRLTATDVRVTLQFAVLSLVILPWLPDRGLGPYEALNPRNIWLMVVLIQGVGLAGYVSWRLFGPRGGVLITGLLGGVVSSTATTVAYARDTREAPQRAATNALIVLLASSVVFVRITVLVALVAPGLLPQVAPIAGAALLAGGPIAWRWSVAEHRASPGAQPELANPTRLHVAVTFGAIYGAVLLGVSWLNDVAGSAGLYVLAFISGLTDVDAIGLSTMRAYTQSELTADVAVTAISIALVSNLLLKAAAAWAVGGRLLAARLLWPFAAIAVAVAVARVVVVAA
jgi:uncharacterized membrane protein (DUF4010 family)